MQPDFAKSGIALFALRNPKYRAHLRASLPFWLNEVFEHYGEVVAFRVAFSTVVLLRHSFSNMINVATN